MMRALWTAASGMEAQQFNVDVISNNLSNVNTTGYKKERAEFKDLLYETMSRAYNMEEEGKPVNLQVGHGTRAAATVKDFETGNLDETGGDLDFAVEGEGFFMVQGPDGNVMYTKDGSFKASITEDGWQLTTADGYPVLDEAGEPLTFSNMGVSDLIISERGELAYKDEEGVTQSLGQTIGLARFTNVQALESKGRNLYASNGATGEATLDSESTSPSLIRQGYLESSNVKTVEEMVKLIVAQRAYELNSKAIQSSDEMLGIANGLKR
jgi:flagellar basal-body rod protein FlgG